MNVWEQEQQLRHNLRNTICPTGCPWLDDGWCGGLNNEQLVMFGAKTGTGKTHFAVLLSLAASKAKKRVYYFALEAARFEIERRRLYNELHRVLREHLPSIKMPRFREWLHQAPDEEWAGLEKYATSLMDKEHATLTVKYRTSAYAPDEFERDAHEIVHEHPDLIILDHLHHFLLQGHENDALKSAIRTIDRLRNDLGIPVVVLAQVRKNDGRLAKNALSKMEDIRGTAALSDIATDVITLSRVPEEISLSQSLFNPTMLHIGKSRTAPEMQRFVAALGFDYKTGGYQPWYQLLKFSEFDGPKDTGFTDIPEWAKNAKPTSSMSNYAANQ